MEETKRQSPTKMNNKHSGKITLDFHSSITKIVLYNSSNMKFLILTFSTVIFLSENQQDYTIRKRKYTDNDGQCSNRSGSIYVYIVIEILINLNIEPEY